jgi:hypothetical protein
MQRISVQLRDTMLAKQYATHSAAVLLVCCYHCLKLLRSGTNAVLHAANVRDSSACALLCTHTTATGCSYKARVCSQNRLKKVQQIEHGRYLSFILETDALVSLAQEQ